MTREELDAIRARCDAATSGPWSSKAHLSGFCVGLDWREHFSAFDVSPHIASGVRGGAKGNDGLAQAAADGEFIANARADMPALLAEVERLRTALREVAS